MSQRAIQAFASLLPKQAQALTALSNSSVEFIIVGGYAMRYHRVLYVEHMISISWLSKLKTTSLE